MQTYKKAKLEKSPRIASKRLGRIITQKIKIDATTSILARLFCANISSNIYNIIDNKQHELYYKTNNRFSNITPNINNKISIKYYFYYLYCYCFHNIIY